MSDKKADEYWRILENTIRGNGWNFNQLEKKLNLAINFFSVTKKRKTYLGYERLLTILKLFNLRHDDVFPFMYDED